MTELNTKKRFREPWEMKEGRLNLLFIFVSEISDGPCRGGEVSLGVAWKNFENEVL